MNRFFSAWALPAIAFAVLPPVAPALAAVTVVSDVGYLEAGRAERLDLYLPDRHPDAAPVPGIVWIHGGGFTGGNKAQPREKNVCGNLAAAGYVCVSPNYRLGPGAWPTNLNDCKNAVRFLRAHAAEYHVDPNRIAVMGGSAGGYLAEMVGFTAGLAQFEPAGGPYPGVSSAVGVVADFYGSCDYLTRQQTTKTGELTGQPLDLTETGKIFGIPPKADPALWRAVAPITYITPSSPPVLILHGLADPLNDYPQALELAQVLSRQGVPHELVMLAHVGHQFDLTTWQKKPLPRDLRPVVLDFLRAYGLGIGAPTNPAG